MTKRQALASSTPSSTRKKKKAPYFASSPTPSSNIHMPTILARQDALVFVDPEDSSALFWWPAVVIARKDWPHFFECMQDGNSAAALPPDATAHRVGSDASGGLATSDWMGQTLIASSRRTREADASDIDALVCYFEDASYSMVPHGALVPFRPRNDPFKRYASELGTFFTEDAAVKAACHYWSTGEPPMTFKWLSAALCKRHRKEHDHHLIAKPESVLATTVPAVSPPPPLPASSFKAKAGPASEAPGPSPKAIATCPPLSPVLQRWIAAFADD